MTFIIAFLQQHGSTIFSISVIVFAVVTWFRFKEVHQGKLELLKERNSFLEEKYKHAKDDKEDLEKLYRKKEELTAFLNKENITPQNLISEISMSNRDVTFSNDPKKDSQHLFSDEVKVSIETLLQDIVSDETKEMVFKSKDPELYLSLAEGYAITDNWLAAAEYFGNGVRSRSNTF